MCDKFTKRGHTVFACEIAAKSHRAANYLASNTKIKSRKKKNSFTSNGWEPKTRKRNPQ